MQRLAIVDDEAPVYELERRRLEAVEPGITQVEWGPNGEVLLPGHLVTRPGEL
jgi:two-component system, probable response regulator PhcQ